MKIIESTDTAGKIGEVAGSVIVIFIACMVAYIAVKYGLGL